MSPSEVAATGREPPSPDQIRVDQCVATPNADLKSRFLRVSICEIDVGIGMQMNDLELNNA